MSPQQNNPPRRRRFGLSAAAVAAVALAATGCATSSPASLAGSMPPAARPATVSHSTATPLATLGAAAAADPQTCTSSYDKSGQSLDVSMYNSTSQVLTLDPALTGHIGRSDHWDTRPPATLQPGQCAEMTAYESNATGYFVVSAVYTMPNGDYVVFSADNHNNVVDATAVFSAAPTFLAPDGGNYTGWKGSMDTKYQIRQGIWTGYYHSHIALMLEGGETSSYQLTSGAFQVAPGPPSPTWGASCPLGYHARWSGSGPAVTFTGLDGTESVDVSLSSAHGTEDDGIGANNQQQYIGFSYSVKTDSTSAANATMTWTCDPSSWPDSQDGYVA